MIATILSLGVFGIVVAAFVGIVVLTIGIGLIKLFIAFAQDLGGLILAVGFVCVILFGAACLRGSL